MLQTIRALHHFLQSNNIPTQGVSITIEFDDMRTAYRANDAMKRELWPSIRDFDPVDQPQISTARITDIPVKIVAKIQA